MKIMVTVRSDKLVKLGIDDYAKKKVRKPEQLK